MKSKFPLRAFWIVIGVLSVFGSCTQDYTVRTEILKWKDGKKAAVSLTYDDGTLNQFRIALPIMEEFDMRGTFYINTGEIPGQKHEAKYFGRDPKIMIDETASIPTNQENYFERAGLIRFLEIPGAVSFHDRSGATYEQGRIEEAYRILDEGYVLARKLKTINLIPPQIIDGPMIDWDELRTYAARGHEFGVHTISHPRLAVLDEENLLFELEKCAEDIERELGKAHLFSAECPFGTENERVMEYALDLFPATRNRMPESYLEEINRSGTFDVNKDYQKEYVQFQRGPLSRTDQDLMKSWIDDIITRNDIWLVLVFHGIEGIGWEAISEDRIRDYFTYIASKSEDVWVAPFREVTKYMRQRMASEVMLQVASNEIKIELKTDLDPYWYDQPLTLKTYFNMGWEKVRLVQGNEEKELEVQQDEGGQYVQYDYLPSKGSLILKSI